VQMSDDERWIDTLAMRFASSKSCCEVMARSARSHTPYEEQVRGALTRVNALAEESVSHNLAGNHEAAVRSLLVHGTETLNPKLIDMAHLAWQRYQARLQQADEMRAAIEELKRRYGNQGYQMHLGRSEGRQAGGLALRAGPATRERAAAPADALASQGAQVP
jgi:hypothetical protein